MEAIMSYTTSCSAVVKHSSPSGTFLLKFQSSPRSYSERTSLNNIDIMEPPMNVLKIELLSSGG